MDVEQIRRVGRALPRYLDEFADCFGRCDTREYLQVYAKASHTRTTYTELSRRGIDIHRIRSCLDSNFALYC